MCANHDARMRGQKFCYARQNKRRRRSKATDRETKKDSPRGGIREGYPFSNVFYADAPRGDDFCVAASFSLPQLRPYAAHFESR